MRSASLKAGITTESAGSVIMKAIEALVPSAFQINRRRTQPLLQQPHLSVNCDNEISRPVNRAAIHAGGIERLRDISAAIDRDQPACSAKFCNFLKDLLGGVLQRHAAI